MKKTISFVVGLVLGAALVSPLLAQAREYVFISGIVSSADHELQEGYVNIGNETTVIAKPGSDLHRLFVRYRGKMVYVTVETELPEREKIER